MSLDLSQIKQMVEDEFMDDVCTITRDEDLLTDETWDPVTLTYSGGDAPVTVYGPGGAEGGKCWVSSNTPAAETNEGGAMVQSMWYWLHIPLSADPVQDGDLVTINSSLRDPELVGKTFIIQHDEVGTFKIKRKIRMRRVIVNRTS